MSHKFTGKHDFVGSFLRPEQLVKARQDYKEGKIDRPALKQVEDQEIEKLINKLKELGYEFITDGEFRRDTWHLDFMWGFHGVDHKPTNTGIQFSGIVAELDDTFLVDKLSFNENHPFLDHLAFVQQFEDENHTAKLTVPAPAQFLKQFISPEERENTGKFYNSRAELADDIVSLYRQFIQKAYDSGLRYLQFDDVSWGRLVDDKAPEHFGTDQAGVEELKQVFVDTNNRVIADRPEDLVVNTHVCRGNFQSTYSASGPYDRVAEFLFEEENVNSYFLEFDDDRSGGFEPLQKISGDKEVVLGLITSKRPELEDKDQIIDRIHQAAEYIPLDRLSLSPQCGFASTEHGNKLSLEDQWNKLRLVKDIADEVWA